MKNIINYIKVARPQTLIASVSPVLIAVNQASTEKSIINMNLAWICLIIGISIQIATNVFNDIIDGDNGVDDNRVGPKRMTSSNTLSKKNLYIMAIIFIIFSSILSINLLSVHWLYLPIGVTCVYFSYGYTGGPYPLAYNRLGEIFVFIYFGLVAYIGTYFALTESLNSKAFLIASILGFLSILLIYANNYRDMINDLKFNKVTLAGSLGQKNAKKLFLFFVIILSLLKIIAAIFYSNYFLLSLVTDILTFILILKDKPKVIIFKSCIINLLISTIIIATFI